MEELNEPHAALGKSPRQQAVRGVGARLAGLRPVEIEDVLVLVGKVDQFWHCALHAKGQFVLSDARGDLGVTRLRELDLVEQGQFVEHLAARIRRKAHGIREKQHGVALRAKLDTLIRGGQEAATPQAIVERLIIRVARALRDHDYERRQIAIRAPQSVREPGSHARATRQLGTGLKKRDRRIVVDGLGVQRADEA
jgi:hypothetical protein